MARISEGGNIQKPTKPRTAAQSHPPIIRIVGRLNLNGKWNIRSYEYDDTFERLQLHKSGTKGTKPLEENNSRDVADIHGDFQEERHAGGGRRHMTEDEVFRCQRYLTADEAEKRRINQMITDQFAGNDSRGSEESVEDEGEEEPDEESAFDEQVRSVEKQKADEEAEGIEENDVDQDDAVDAKGGANKEDAADEEEGADEKVAVDQERGIDEEDD